MIKLKEKKLIKNKKNKRKKKRGLGKWA